MPAPLIALSASVMMRRERGSPIMLFAEQLGISFQQPRSTNRGRTDYGRSSRKDRCRTDVAIGYFLKGAVALTHSDIMQTLQGEAAEEFDIFDLLTAFLKIEEDDVRLMIVNLARAAADGRTPDRPLN
jgi:hypothetical protein